MVKLIVTALIIILGVLFSFGFFGSSRTKARKQYVVVVCILLALLSGLRNIAVGTDTYQYSIHFSNVQYETWNELLFYMFEPTAKDPFYALFQKFFQIFSTDYQLYLLFVAFIFMSAFGHFIFTNTSEIRHAVLAFVIYMANFYGFFSITGIRQTLATAMLFWAYHFIKLKKPLWFLVFVVIAGLFHKSAFVFLPLYVLVRFMSAKYIFILSVLGFPLVFMFKNFIASFFVNFVDAGDRFGDYLAQNTYSGSLVLTVLHIVLGVLALILYKNTIKLFPHTKRMFITFAVALFFFPLQWVNPSAGRVSQYFTVIMMVWLPYLLDTIANDNYKFREMVYVYLIAAFVFLSTFTISENDYKFFWQEMELPAVYR